MQVTITLSRHIERAVKRASRQRHMPIPELCQELVEVALVSLGEFNKTPLDELATRQSGGEDIYPDND